MPKRQQIQSILGIKSPVKSKHLLYLADIFEKKYIKPQASFMVETVKRIAKISKFPKEEIPKIIKATGKMLESKRGKAIAIGLAIGMTKGLKDVGKKDTRSLEQVFKDIKSDEKAIYSKEFTKKTIKQAEGILKQYKNLYSRIKLKDIESSLGRRVGGKIIDLVVRVNHWGRGLSDIFFPN